MLIFRYHYSENDLNTSETFYMLPDLNISKRVLNFLLLILGNKLCSMEKLFQDIKQLTKQSRLIPAEEVITRCLLPFDEVHPQNFSDAEIEQYEGILIDLFYVNSGILSLQCSIRISTCLISLYQKQPTPKLWNLFTAVTKKPTVTGILVIGNVIDKIGQHSRSMIPGLVKIIIPFPDLFSVIYALTSSFKQNLSELKSYSDKSFHLVKKSFQISSSSQLAPNLKEEATQLLAIQLLQKIYSTEMIPQKKIFGLINEILQNHNLNTYSTFVIDQVCYFIAFAAYYPLRNDQQEKASINDFEVGNSQDEKSQFEASFELLSNYKNNHFSSILRHFLNFLSPNFVLKNLSCLFNFVRKIQPSEISQLLSLFGHDVRGELFKEIAQEQPPNSQQQKLLRSLSFNDKTNAEIAALSLQLTTSSSTTERLYGASYFSYLAEKYPQSAETYLNMSVLYLSCPPEDNPTLDIDIFGMALIASHIIGATPEKRRQALIDSVSDNLKVFFTRSYENKNIFSSQFMATFMLLAVLPPSFVDPQKCANLLSLFNDKFKHTPSITSPTSLTLNHTEFPNINLIRACTQYMASFLATHPHIEEHRRFLEILAQNTALQSLTATLCSFIASTEASLAHLVMTTYFIPQIMKVNPNKEYVSSLLSTPLLTPQELIHNIRFEMHPSDIIYFRVDDNYFSFRSIDFFPNAILSLDESVATNCVLELVSNPSYYSQNPLMCHSLLLSLLKNVATQPYIPSNLNQFIMPTLELNTTNHIAQTFNGYNNTINKHLSSLDSFNGTFGDSFLRIQVTSECAVIWASLHDEIFTDLLSYMQKLDGIGKCFIYASMVSYIQLGDTTIINVLHDLNELAKVPLFCPYALFALSTLLSVYSLRLVDLTVADMQFPFLLSIIHNNSLSLSPYTLYFASTIFARLLPIISPEIKGSMAEPYVRLLIQCFYDTPISYASQIMFHTLRACFAFAKEFVDTKKLIFPLDPGTTTSFQITACGAFSDMLKVHCDFHHDNNFFFDLLPDLLILLQKQNDHRVVDFIVQISLHFVEVRESITVNQIQELTRMIKSVLTTSSLPNVQIEASIQVKRVCSSISSQVLDLLKSKENTENQFNKFNFPENDSTDIDSKPSFFNECLDDLMASSTRAIETEDSSLMINSYSFLNDVLTKFKDKKTVNDLPFLELYDSQFSIAIRFAFSSNSSASLSATFVNQSKSESDAFYQAGKFLINYLVFHTTNLIQKPENFSTVLNGYSNGFSIINEIIQKNQQQKKLRVDAFYNLISKFTNIARQNKDVFNKIENLLPMFETELSFLINESITILSKEKSSSKEASQVAVSIFRSSKSDFYNQMLVAYIWLHSVINSNNDDTVISRLITFLTTEIQSRKTEEWRTKAAVEAITCFIEYNKSLDSSNDLIEKAIQAIQTLKLTHNSMYIEIGPRFLNAICIIVLHNQESHNFLLKRGTQLWKTVLDMAIDENSFNCSAIAILIGQDALQNVEINNKAQLIEHIVSTVFIVAKSNDLTLSLLTVLIPVSWKYQLNFLFRSKLTNSLKMKLLTRILKQISYDDFIKGQSQETLNGYFLQYLTAYIKMFAKGGMNQLASIIIENPKIGFAILNLDHFRQLSSLPNDDFQNSVIYLQFILMCVEELQPQFMNDYKIDNSTLNHLINFSMKFLISKGSDPQKGRDIVDLSVRIINSINNLIGTDELMKKNYFELSQREIQILTNLTEKQADKVKSRQNALNLKQFSEKTVKKSSTFDENGKRIDNSSSDDDGWETLEIDNN